ncbi:Glycosyltransferase incomplete domain containing protein [Pandoravirus salinus]|uniref:Glycosyltransferase incomplete domain containing protein n=1 Tax=Pandoravirus salinus TaxID=1349410 RepID=S4W358_9VIRU|nr:Capsular polysaccharide synthesis incomplete domain [Pandoravirus salinus]AGO85002.1 Glycosyltransferase incomplete domain containing protein [Pandoravirus salinus]
MGTCAPSSPPTTCLSCAPKFVRCARRRKSRAWSAAVRGGHCFFFGSRRHCAATGEKKTANQKRGSGKGEQETMDDAGVPAHVPTIVHAADGGGPESGDLADEVAAVRDADYDRGDAPARAQAALDAWRQSQTRGDGTATNQTVIPRILHKVWFDMGKGARPSRRVYGAMDDALQALHPAADGWTVVRWGLASAERLIAERYADLIPTWRSYASPIYKADAIRYLILLAFGGIYVDQDVLPLRSLGPMIARPATDGGPRCAVLVRSPHWLREISNFVMAARPGSAVMAAATADLPRRAASLWHVRDSFVGTMSVAGPRVLAAAWRRAADAEAVCVLGPSSFASVLPRGADEHPADAGYGVHGFKSAWGVGRKIAVDALRAAVVVFVVLAIAAAIVFCVGRRRTAVRRTSRCAP